MNTNNGEFAMNKQAFEKDQLVAAMDSLTHHHVICEDPPGSGVWLLRQQDTGELSRKGQAVLRTLEQLRPKVTETP